MTTTPVLRQCEEMDAIKRLLDGLKEREAEHPSRARRLAMQCVEAALDWRARPDTFLPDEPPKGQA